MESFPTAISVKGMTIKAKITAEKVSQPLESIESVAAKGMLYAPRYLRSFILSKIKKDEQVSLYVSRNYICKKHLMPIQYVYNTDFKLQNEQELSSWLNRVIKSEQYVLGHLTYAFFSDEDLKTINIKHLNREYYTDVISFDDSCDEVINGNIAISVERVKENSKDYNCDFLNEMLRVMVHGLLHLMGFNDKTKDEKVLMRNAENEKINMFHVEH